MNCKKCGAAFDKETIPFGTSGMCCDCWDKYKQGVRKLVGMAWTNLKT